MNWRNTAWHVSNIDSRVSDLHILYCGSGIVLWINGTAQFVTKFAKHVWSSNYCKCFNFTSYFGGAIKAISDQLQSILKKIDGLSVAFTNIRRWRSLATTLSLSLLLRPNYMRTLSTFVFTSNDYWMRLHMNSLNLELDCLCIQQWRCIALWSTFQNTSIMYGSCLPALSNNVAKTFDKVWVWLFI